MAPPNPFVPNQLFPDQGDPFAASAPTPADAYTANAQAYQSWLAQQRASGVAAGMLDPQTGWPTQNALLDAARQYGSAMIGSTSAPGFRAYHGSPHSFDQFQSSAIGTGEGAQAYGHGLYFADKEAIAKSYRDNLSSQLSPQQSAAAMEATTRHQNAEYAMNHLHDKMVKETISGGAPLDPGWGELGVSPTPEIVAKYKDQWDALSGQLDQAHKDYSAIINGPRPKGSMYEVNIGSDPAHFLDWDAPLSQQSAHVQQALGQTGHLPRSLDTSLLETEAAKDPNGWYASQLDYVRNQLARSGSEIAPRSAEDAARFQSAGIPGIRYFDAGARSSGEGTRNTVVFDPATIEILRKYGIAGLMAGGAAATQTQ